MGQVTIRALNKVPEGKTAWLPYIRYQELRRLFNDVDLPEFAALDEKYFRLHRFLCEVLGDDLPETKESIHQNAWTLLRRGYEIETITEDEYLRLKALFNACNETDNDDMELHPEGSHRALYNYLNHGLGLFIEAGRGPVWYRAKALLNHHNEKNSNPTGHR